MHTLFLHCHCPGRQGCRGQPSSSQPSSQSWCRSHSSQCGMQWWVPGHCSFFAPHTAGTEPHSHLTLHPTKSPLGPSQPSGAHLPQSCSSEPSGQSAAPSHRQLLETQRPSSHCHAWGSPPQGASVGTAHGQWGQHTVSGISHSSGNNHYGPLCPSIRGGGSRTHPHALRGCPAQDVPPKPPPQKKHHRHSPHISSVPLGHCLSPSHSQGTGPQPAPQAACRVAAHGGPPGAAGGRRGGRSALRHPPPSPPRPGMGTPNPKPLPPSLPPAPSHGLGGPRGAAGGRRG